MSNNTKNKIEEWKFHRKKIEESFVSNSWNNKSNKSYKKISLPIKILKFIIKLTGKKYWQERSKKIVKNNIKIISKSLPDSFNGFKILHLSDLHLDCLPGIEEKICELIKDEYCDIAIITGDLKDRYDLSFEKIKKSMHLIVQNIKSKCGIY